MRTGDGITLTSAVLTAWSGLRGIVGLALALYVLVDPGIGNAAYRSQAFFFMSTTLVLTVVVQGSLYGALLMVRAPSLFTTRQCLGFICRDCIENHLAVAVLQCAQGRAQTCSHSILPQFRAVSTPDNYMLTRQVMIVALIPVYLVSMCRFLELVSHPWGWMRQAA